MICNLNILYIAICSNYIQGMFKNWLHGFDSFVSLSPNAAIGQASSGSSCTSDYILVRKLQRYFWDRIFVIKSYYQWYVHASALEIFLTMPYFDT